MSDEPETPAEAEDAASSFAALMSNAAKSVDDEADEAPYGYMKDRATGEIRPKKVPGRAGVKNSPSLDELKAAKSEAVGDTETPVEEISSTEPVKDRAPARPARGSQKRQAKAEKKAAEPVPQYREGVIAKGMNKLYARAGKLVKVMDPDIGTAILSMTKKESDDDVTVGEAWDELARTNPRIRKFLLKMVAGGAWGQIVMAHAPLFMAIIMKDGIRKHIPFMKLIDSMLDDDDDGNPSDIAQSLGGMTGEDVGQMMQMAQGLMAQMGQGMPRGGTPRMPTGVPGTAATWFAEEE